MSRKLTQFWRIITHANTVMGVLGFLLGSFPKIVGAVLGAVGGGLVTWIGDYGPALGFIVVVVGSVGGVWLVNGVAWGRKRRRDAKQQASELDVSFTPDPHQVTILEHLKVASEQLA